MALADGKWRWPSLTSLASFGASFGEEGSAFVVGIVRWHRSGKSGRRRSAFGIDVRSSFGVVVQQRNEVASFGGVVGVTNKKSVEREMDVEWVHFQGRCGVGIVSCRRHRRHIWPSLTSWASFGVDGGVGVVGVVLSKREIKSTALAGG